MGEHVSCSIEKTTLCIEKVPFFQNLQAADKLAVVKKSYHSRYKKGEIILATGDVLDSLYIVHQGKVKIYTLADSGKEHILRVLTTGDFLGELAIFAERTVDSFAEATENTEICKISRDNMHALMLEHPQISVSILEQMSKRLRETEHLANQLSTQDVESRIVSYLLDEQERLANNTIRLTMSKKDLASHLGTSQETLSRRLTKLQEEGIIEQEGQRTIHLLQIEQLEMLR